ncbi:MAG TPA: hypothetical protein VJV23_08100 [Candidatus Polarisedimenticolia bacterium]|nr:hypothetical protein [Candidatus Polarisedimenticolia bacterium]
MRSAFCLAASILACALAPSGGVAQAACPASRPFSSEDNRTIPFGLFSSESDAFFWALGSGSPVAGEGHDNGTLGVCTWLYSDEDTCIVESLAFRISGNWAAPGVDGCIDQAGATPSLDGDECMVMMFAVQDVRGVPHAAVRSRRPTGPAFDFSTPVRTVRFSALPAPTITRIRSLQENVAELTLRLPPGLPAGSSFDPSCTQGIFAGSGLFSREVLPGSGPPTAGRVQAGSPWISTGSTFPSGQPAVVMAECGTGKDLFFAARPMFDSGFTTSWLSLASSRASTGSDSDLDGVADACDPCTDTDGDGAGNPGFLASSCRTDNCPVDPNPAQEDADGDGVGDRCERCPGLLDPRPVALLDDASPQHTLGRFIVPPGGRRVAYIGWQETPAFELYSVSTGGMDTRRLSGPMTTGGNVSVVQASPDGALLLYMADQIQDEVVELFSVPADGSGPPVRLNGELTAEGDVRQVLVAPQGGRAVYLADQEVNERVELFVVPQRGGEPAVKLNAPLDAGDQVLSVALTPDGTHAVYHTGPPRERATRLWSVPLSGAPAVLLAGPEHFIGSAIFTPDSATVVYVSCQTGFVNCVIHRIPITGGEAVRLTPDSPLLGVNEFQISPDGMVLVFTTETESQDVFDLFAVPLSGGEAVRLSKPFPAGSTGAKLFFDLAITPDGSRAVYTAEQDTAGVTELYSVPLAGGAVTRLNPPLVFNGNVRHPFEFAVSAVFRLTPDGQSVIYRADQERNEVFELYRVPVTGGAAVRLHAPLPLTGDVSVFQLSPDGSTVAFSADDSVDGSFELLAVPVAGTATSPVRLGDAPLVPVYGTLGGTQLFEVAPDSPHIVYRSARGLGRTLMQCSAQPPPPPVHLATVRVVPPVLGPRRVRAAIHLVVGLAERSDAEIDPATVSVTANGVGPLPLWGATRLAGDTDEDGAAELLLRLRRTDVPPPAEECGPVRFEVTGRLVSAEPFSGTAEVRGTCAMRRMARREARGIPGS